jgi:alpha-galactosidase
MGARGSFNGRKRRFPARAVGCGVTEQDVRSTADAFVATGMKDAGYEYVNVDDCWMAMNRTAEGKLRTRSHCRCVLLPIHFIPKSLKYSVSRFLNRQCDRTLGKLTHDPQRFPSGMKALANYVQGKGLKFGLYSARCGKTCQGRPASQDHEWVDAETFASWDVDYLKYDNCMECKYGYTSEAYIMQVTRMGDAIRAAGRPIFYSTVRARPGRLSALSVP